MTRVLAAVAALTVIAAAVLAGDTAPTAPPPGPAASSRTPQPTLAQPPAARTPTSPLARGEGEAASVAVAYALAARNWSARTLKASWRRQRALASSPYRRTLDPFRPTRGQLAAIASERASSIATLAALPTTHPARHHTRVVVVLHERTASAGRATTATTRNQVALERSHGRWRVTSWTILPAEGS